MKKSNHKEREFLERLMRKDFFRKEKMFLNRMDIQKQKLVQHRDDLASMPLISEDHKERLKAKLEDLCGHFSTVAVEREDENLYAHWPPYFDVFMTPRMFSLISNSWFTQEFGFCFACKHFKGEKKGHHKFFHMIKNRKVIGLYGTCEKRKELKRKKETNDIFLYNNHVMPNFRCRGWEPARLYEQILRHRVLRILKDKNNNYNTFTFEIECGGGLTLCSFMDEGEKYNKNYDYFY